MHGNTDIYPWILPYCQHAFAEIHSRKLERQAIPKQASILQKNRGSSVTSAGAKCHSVRAWVPIATCRDSWVGVDSSLILKYMYAVSRFSLQVLLHLLCEVAVSLEADDALLDLALPMFVDSLLPGKAPEILATTSHHLAIIAAICAQASNRQAGHCSKSNWIIDSERSLQVGVLRMASSIHWLQTQCYMSSQNLAGIQAVCMAIFIVALRCLALHRCTVLLGDVFKYAFYNFSGKVRCCLQVSVNDCRD